jgi:hypothetical protein
MRVFNEVSLGYVSVVPIKSGSHWGLGVSIDKSIYTGLEGHRGARPEAVLSSQSVTEVGKSRVDESSRLLPAAHRRKVQLVNNPALRLFG